MLRLHYNLEKISMGLVVVIIAAASVGGAVEIAPLFTIDQTVEIPDDMRPLTPLELAGREVFIREGCYACHSQMVRHLAQAMVGVAHGGNDGEGHGGDQRRHVADAEQHHHRNDEAEHRNGLQRIDDGNHHRLHAIAARRHEADRNAEDAGDQCRGAGEIERLHGRHPQAGGRREEAQQPHDERQSAPADPPAWPTGLRIATSTSRSNGTSARATTSPEPVT